jgi:hypothetical protein
MGASKDGANGSRVKRWVIWLIIPNWAALAVELLGQWRSGHPLDVGAFWALLIVSVMVAVVVSPFLISFGFDLISKSRPGLCLRRDLLARLKLLLIVSSLVNTWSCLWSCGSHPTWTSGFK